MGEVLGIGKRFEFIDDGEGVRASDALSELGEPENETVRALREEVLIAMGSECLNDRFESKSLLLPLLVTMVRNK